MWLSAKLELIIRMNCTGSIIPVPYLCLGFLLGVLLLAVVPFFVLVAFSFEEICREYDTVSSFCANPKKPGNRFLLITCTVIGCSLAVIYSDEYNSNQDSTPRFALRFLSACLMPLVGFFYTRNKLAKAPQYYDCGFAEMPIWISDAIHTACALLFLIIHSVCCIWGALALQHVALVSCASVATALFCVFVLIQAELRLVTNGPALQRALFASSFCLEFTAITALILVNVLVSFYANKNLQL